MTEQEAKEQVQRAIVNTMHMQLAMIPNTPDGIDRIRTYVQRAVDQLPYPYNHFAIRIDVGRGFRHAFVDLQLPGNFKA